MIQILTYGEINREEWETLIKESKTGTWFQTPEAYDFFASMPELFRPFAVGVVRNPESNSGLMNEETLRGVCVGYVTVEKNPIKQFFTRRAIIIGGPALADDSTEEEVEVLMKAVREMLQSQAIYVETRNFNDYSRWKGAFEAAGFEYQAHLNFHVDCSNAEAMWNRMSDNRRRQIKKQIKNEGMSELVIERVTEQDIREWYEILAKLYREKVRTPLWSVEFFLEAYRQGIGHYMLVRHEGRIIGGSMIMADEGCVYEWFECGLNAEYKEQYPSVMATYAGMQYAHENSCQRYDMMGAGVPGVPYGVRDFKAEFGGKMVDHGRFLHVAKPIFYAIGKLGVKMMKG